MIARRWGAANLAGLLMLALALPHVPALAQPDGAVLAPALADSGDTGWLLAASLLALLAGLAGLALFFSGQARAEQRGAVLLLCAATACLASLGWVAAGYTLAFGLPAPAPGVASPGWIGSANTALLADIAALRPGTRVPESAFALVQMGFAILASVLMIGGFAGRARASWALGFAGLWGIGVYAPLAHWLWGGGWLARLGALDFAGGLVVHTSAGVSALVIALLLGPRAGPTEASAAPPQPEPSDRCTLVLAGAALFWIGSLALAGASALGANDNAASALLAAHLAASAGALVWLLLERVGGRAVNVASFARGAFAGLATIAPAAVFIAPGAAMLLGALGAAACHGALREFTQRWRIGDETGVFAIHGVGGIVGTLLLALFLSPALGGTGYFGAATMASQLAAQLAGIGAVVLWSGFASAIIALAVSAIAPMQARELGAAPD